MDEDKVLALFGRLERGQQEQRQEMGELRSEMGKSRSEAGEFRSEMGKFRFETGEFRSEMDKFRFETGEFRSEMGEFRRRTEDFQRDTLVFRTVVMSKFERLEDRVEMLSNGLALNVEQVGSLLDQLTAREAQLAMLQDAIRAGINAESIQVRAVQRTLVSMNSMVLQLQSQLADLSQRMDEVQQPAPGTAPGL